MTSVLLAAALLLGGATRSGFLSDATLQVLAIPLLVACLLRTHALVADRHTRLPFLFAVALFVLPLLQLIPLPPGVWSALPHRQEIVEAYALAGSELRWMPLSVSPEATWLGALSLLPALSVFFGTLLLNWEERRWLTLVAIAIGTVGAFIGLAQVSQGPFSDLRFIATSHNTEAVGFFANRNHFAALLYSLLLLVTAWLIYLLLESGARRGNPTSRIPVIVAAIAALACQLVLLGAIAMARSRAGLALTIGGLIGAVALAMSDRRTTSGVTPVKALIGTTAIAVVLVAQFSLYRVLERFAYDPLADDRFVFARNTIEAAKAYWPFGSGLGTFVSVYGLFERATDVIRPNLYANRAHNDWLELGLETGVFGVVLMGLFLVWLLHRSYAVWWQPWPGTRDIDRGLARAASVVVLLLLVHSIVDYPLRTTAMMSVLALVCALMVEPLDRRAQDRPAAVQPAFKEDNLPSSPADLVRPRKAELWSNEAEVEWPEEWRLPPKR